MGIRTTNIAQASAVDELLANVTLDGVSQTVRVPVGVLGQQIAQGSGAIVAKLVKATFAQLDAAKASMGEGDIGIVQFDPTPSLNGQYALVGGVLVKKAALIETQAKQSRDEAEGFRNEAEQFRNDAYEATPAHFEDLRDETVEAKGLAVLAADVAEEEADRAEAARDGARTSAGVYASTAAGLAATSNGQQFHVPAADPTELIRYQNNSGVAAEVPNARMPTSAGLRAIDAFHAECPWLHPDALTMTGLAAGKAWSATLRMVARAIKRVEWVSGYDPAKTYFIGTFCVDDGTYGDQISLLDTAGNIVASAGTANVAPTTNGLTRRVLASGNVRVELLINYAEISGSGILVNSATTTVLLISRNWRELYEAETRNKASATAVSALARAAERVTTWRNLVPNGANDPDEQALSWSGAVNLASPPTSQLMRDRGIKRTVRHGSDGGTAVFPNLDVFKGQANGKFFFVGAYAYSSNSVWPTGLSAYWYKAGPVLNTIVLSNYIELGPTDRFYYATGQWAADADPLPAPLGLRLGVGGLVAGTNFEVGGYTYLEHTSVLGIDDIRMDDWYPQHTRQTAVVETSRKATVATDLLSAGADRALRVSCTGSSITQGGGYLGEDSIVGAIEDHLRSRLATTILASSTAMTLSGTVTGIASSRHYKQALRKLAGINAAAAFEITGDELSLVIARERGNDGAAMVELYVDGTLFDTFSTFNEEPYAVGLEESFVGDGVRKWFLLARNFTFNHVVTVGGVAKAGAINGGGYGATLPGVTDYMVFRVNHVGPNGPEVRHAIYFGVAPANLAEVDVTYDAGENIGYMKATYGEIGKGLSTALENVYGEANPALAVASAPGMVNMLGFRQTDPRAVKTWRFGGMAKRSIRLRVKELDPRATGTPCLYLNFATNRMHHVQNAGIGGWTANALLTNAYLNSYRSILDFQPDAVFWETATNDDNAAGVRVNKAWRTRTALTDAQVRNDESRNAFNAVTYVSPDNYTVQDVRIPITAITENSATFDLTGGTFSIAAGDVIVLGDYKNDNRRVTSRIVDTWTVGTGVVTWKERLSPAELVHVATLADLVGQTAFVFNAPGWTGDITTVVGHFRDHNPDMVIALGTSGIPNQNDRALTGYRELGMKLAKTLGLDGFMDFYAATGRWTYSQVPSTRLYVDNALGTESTGASSYALYLANGTKPADQTMRPVSVLVDGVERLNRDCHISGGRKKGWPGGVTPMSLVNWSFVQADFVLNFTDDVPAAGADFIIRFAPADWSADDTHPPAPVGQYLFGKAELDVARRLLATALTKAAPHRGMMFL